MEMVPKACPNLRELHLHLLNDVIEQQSFRERIQQVLDDPSFTFPLLQKFFCIYFMNCNTFMVHHPGIDSVGLGLGSGPQICPVPTLTKNPRPTDSGPGIPSRRVPGWVCLIGTG